jgi:hypothetical protein
MERVRVKGSGHGILDKVSLTSPPAAGGRRVSRPASRLVGLLLG